MKKEQKKQKVSSTPLVLGVGGGLLGAMAGPIGALIGSIVGAGAGYYFDFREQAALQSQRNTSNDKSQRKLIHNH